MLSQAGSAPARDRPLDALHQLRTARAFQYLTHHLRHSCRISLDGRLHRLPQPRALIFFCQPPQELLAVLRSHDGP